MNIGDRVTDAIDKMAAADPEGALFQICAAIEVTAKNEFGKPGRGSYKDFIHQNLGLITDIAFGGSKFLNINLGYEHPSLKKNVDGCVPIQDILYHVVRCGLYHDARLPDDLKFADEHQIRMEEHGTLVMPSSLVYGLITAVVVSPTNRGECGSNEGTLNLDNFPIPLSKLWGRREELLWLLDVCNEVRRLHKAASET